MNLEEMDYYQLRSAVAGIIPRMTQLFQEKRKQGAVREKGRKKGYSEYKIDQGDFVSQERLLNTEEINSFVEISCRAAACPMPMNLDVWDGLVCPYKCRYCFANAFRASLYTAFFDNSRTMGFRSCSPDKYKAELDKLMKLRGKDPHTVSGDVAKAFAQEMPVRFGIRFEDFIKPEEKKGVSLELLKYLRDEAYPVMINTKSSLLGKGEYLDALSTNEGKTAVHITLITSDDRILKAIEPGAPPYAERIQAMETLVKAGVRVVARIEPYLPFITDEPEEVQRYIEDLKRIGVEHITFDTYSYSANNPGIRQAFLNVGYDFERIFLIGCDSQGVGSLLLGKFMEIFRAAGLKCSTFDMGNAPSNDDAICCEVGDWFNKSGFNDGCTVMAARFIMDTKGPVTWEMYTDWVNSRGGFLSKSLELEMHQLWNFEGNEAYSCGWAQGVTAAGKDDVGNIVWLFRPENDFRRELYEGVVDDM